MVRERCIDPGHVDEDDRSNGTVWTPTHQNTTAIFPIGTEVHVVARHLRGMAESGVFGVVVGGRFLGRTGLVRVEFPDGENYDFHPTNLWICPGPLVIEEDPF